MQFLIQYSTSICTAVLKFLNPYMSCTISFPSSFLVLLRSRPIGHMSVFFHHITHLDDIKGWESRHAPVTSSQSHEDIHCSRSSTWNTVSSEKKIWKIFLYSVYIFLDNLWEKKVFVAFTISLGADVSFASMMLCTFNDIYYLSTIYTAIPNTLH